jgi:GxxExxY protein
MSEVLTQRIIGAAIEVHRALGPGLLEGIYEECLAYELIRSGIRHERQKRLAIEYKGIKVSADLRIDLVVEDRVILELKSIEKLLPVHGAQLLSYLRLSGLSLGLLINFNVPVLKDGIKRVVNNHVVSAPPRLCVEEPQ